MKIEVEIAPDEIFELAAMTMGAVVTSKGRGKRKQPLIRALHKIGKQCMRCLSEEEKVMLNKALILVKRAYAEPSIERGYLVGGYQAMQERIENMANEQM